VAGLGFKKMIMYEAPYVPTPAAGKTPSQHVAALWELVRADERGAAVTCFMCDVVGMPKIIGFLFRFFPIRVHAAIPGSQLRWLEGQTHNPAAEPAAAMAKEFFLGR
jgi:hypothetical protein